MTSRLKKITYTTAAGLGLFAGAAGIAAAASGNDAPAPAPAAVVEPALEVEAPGDTGINCEDGINTDSPTLEWCEGGPAAALADEATEGVNEENEGVTEENDGVDHQNEGEEVGENGNGVADADDLNGTEVDD